MRRSSPLIRARARYRVAKAVCPKKGTGDSVVWIEDLCYGLSVTNDAENVVHDLQHDFPGYRVIYRDTDGRWDELLHARGRFLGFAPAPGLNPEMPS